MSKTHSVGKPGQLLEHEARRLAVKGTASSFLPYHLICISIWQLTSYFPDPLPLHPGGQTSSQNTFKIPSNRLLSLLTCGELNSVSVLLLQLEQKPPEGKTHTTVSNFPPYCLKLSTLVRTMKQVWFNMCVRKLSAPCTTRAGFVQAALF